MAPYNASSALLVFVLVLLCSCAPKTSIETTIKTIPNGARVFIDGTESLQPTPFNHTFDFKLKQTYELFLQKEGYFEEAFLVTKDLPSLRNGNVTVALSPSPLWEATTFSPATNSWIQVVVDSQIKEKTAWQILLDTVVKYCPSLKEINFESGYLQTRHTVKKFETKNGDFLLRSQLTAALISAKPHIYRIKETSEWSGNGVQWYLYNRIFFEHNEMIHELQRRLTKKQFYTP